MLLLYHAPDLSRSGPPLCGRTVLVVSRSWPEKSAVEASVDPRYNQRYIQRHRKEKKDDRINQRLIANFDHRLLDLVEGHHDREKLVATVTRWNLDHVPDVGPPSHIVNSDPRHATILIGGNETGNH